MTDVVKQEMPVKNLVPLLAIIDDCCATAKQGGLTAEKDRSYTQLMGQLILTNVCTWNDWALASLEADPDRAKGIAAGLYAGNYLLPMLLGTIESWINPEGQAPLTVGLLSAFHKEMQTVGHGLTAAINALDLDAEEKAAYGAIASIAMAGVMKWVKSPQGQLGQVVNGLSETNVAVKSAVITSRFKAAFSKNTTEFLTDLETRSGSGLVKAQRERLLKYATEVKIGKMEETAYRAHEKQYKALSDAMKREWEKNTGQKWPQYGKWNELKQKIVPTDVDLHHIIPQRYGGPHEWWNAHPVHPGNHTGKGGIHADPNSLLKQTLKE
ncbi:hypothetical protein Bealeia1_01974 (plasmid) [Candidatus Bealeia paramacronuclearis]|uniref:HNH endonuclease n=2 Tax=Candidatus Bealeia paramacronuclearis TaxID=1921001 RepID=A0ABZ2C9L3_9PROT